jgi:carbonic anhydrase/acetyltransferase-like protein (isoleucine patch superfamily)
MHVGGGLDVFAAATVNSMSVTDNTASTSTSTGAMVVTGGVGVGGRLNVGGALDVDAAASVNSMSVTDATVSSATTSGALVVTGGVGVGGAMYIGGSLDVFAAASANSMSVTNATASTSTSTGAMVVTGGVGIGGVLEPLQANPTIIEDNCFIGARSEVVEGVIVEENSVLGMGVYIGQSTPLFDRATGEISYGRVPSGSVVVSGNLPKKAANGADYSMYAAIIVKRVDAQTRSKTSINDLLRD